MTLEQMFDSKGLAVTVDDAAAMLGVCRVTAYKAVHNGEIPSFRIGKVIRVPTAELYRMLYPESEPSKSEPLPEPLPELTRCYSANVSDQEGKVRASALPPRGRRRLPWQSSPRVRVRS